MGWTFTNNKPAVLTPAAYIEQECFPADAEREVVLRATVNDAVFLALKVKKPEDGLLRIYEPEADGSVIVAIVVLFEVNGREFGWKTMNETMGPYNDKAPTALLAKLSKLKPNAPGCAAAWRARQEAK